MKLWTIENESVKLLFHPGQSKAWRTLKRFPFIIAGSMGGKTSFGPWWLWREIYDLEWRQKIHPERWEYEPGGEEYLAVTSTYKLFTRKMLKELQTIFCDVLDVGRYWAKDAIFELRDPKTNEFWATHSYDSMWGRILLGAASTPGGLEAAEAKAAWLDECGQDEFGLGAWEAISRRLALHEGRALGTTTPYNLGWLKTEIHDEWEDGDPDIDVINFPSTANPAFSRREFERLKGKMQTWRFGMFHEGRFTQPAGLIYPDFTGAMLVDPFPISDDWTRYLGVDFGGANTALLWGAESPDDGRVYIYDEWLGGGLTSAEYSERALEGLPHDRDSDVTWYAWGGSHSEGQARRDWTIFIDEPLIREVEQGIDRGTQLIKGDRLRVFRTCRGFRDEIGSYKRKLDPEGNPLEDIEHKRRFHRMDAYRYMAVGIIEQSGPWVTFI